MNKIGSTNFIAQNDTNSLKGKSMNIPKCLLIRTD